MTKLLFSPPALGNVLSLTGLPGGGNKIHDRSPYGNTATIVGATWVRLPGGLWCLSFDGSDDYISCADANSLDIAESLTLELWLKFLDTPPAGTAWSIMEKGGRGGSTNNFALYTATNSTALRFGAAFNNAWASFSAISTALGTTNWHHVAITYDGKTVKAYLDAVRDLNQAKTGALSTNNNALTICGTNQYVKGYSVLQRIYNRALTALEIQNHFNQEKHLFGV